MGEGKYICDYCEKEFKDTLGARKRHLQGVFHQRAKALWYSNYHNNNNNININNNYYNNINLNNNNIIQQNVLPKGICNRFVTTHFGEETLTLLEKYTKICQVIPSSTAESIINGRSEGNATIVPEHNTYCFVWKGLVITDQGSCSYGDSCKYIHPRQSLQSLIPQSIPGSVVKGNMRVSLGSLPPSLQPPPEGGYPQLPFIDWG